MFNTKPWNNGFPGIPKEVEQDINNLQSRAAALETANSYSTSEIAIGKWIDGSTLYRKVINIGELPNADAKSVASGLTNIKAIKVYGYATYSNEYFPLPYSYPGTTAQYNISIRYSAGNNIIVNAGTDRSSYTGVAIIEYVKIPPTRDGDTEPEKDLEEVKEPETKSTKKTKKGE